MKVLIDCIPSARPKHCSSIAKMQKLIRRLLDARPDVFVTMLLAEGSSVQPQDDDIEWLITDPRVKYRAYPYAKDRMRAYQEFPQALNDLEAFHGDLCWDWDVLVTNRTAQVANSRAVSQSPRHVGQENRRQIIVFEEMPVMDFKKTVPVSHAKAQNLSTLVGYLVADEVFITIQHEKDAIVRTAKQYFAPSAVTEIRDKIKVVSPSVLTDFSLKPVAQQYPNVGRKFCLGFTGRLGNFASNVRDVYKVMESEWILSGADPIRVAISTVTTGIKIPPPPFVEVMSLPREEFWELLKQGMDVVLCMSVDAGFGMSLMEPLMFGTPVIVLRAEWSQTLLGKDYPFLVDNVAQAVAFLRMFREDYANQYAKFASWQQEKLIPMMLPGGAYGKSLYDEVLDAMFAFETKIAARFAKRTENTVIEAIVAKKKPEIVLFDELQELDDEKFFDNSIVKKLFDKKRSLVFSTDMNEFRLRLKHAFGYKDASVRPGHLHL